MRPLITILLLLIYGNLFSQVKLNVSLGGDYVRGNTDIISLDSRVEIKKDSGRYAWNINPSFRTSHLIEDDKLLNRESYIFAAVEKKWQRWKFIAFTESENSYNRKIDYRGSIGLGAAYKLIETDKLKVDISEAFLPEFIFLSNSSRVSLRASTRLKINYVHRKVKFTSLTLVQPAFYTKPPVKPSNNFNMRSTNLVEFFFTERMSFGLGYDLIVQTYPAYINPEVQPADSRTYFLLKYQIK